MPKIIKIDSQPRRTVLTDQEKVYCLELRRSGAYRYEIVDKLKCSRKCLDYTMIYDPEFAEEFAAAAKLNLSWRAEDQIVRLRDVAANPPTYFDAQGNKRVDIGHVQAIKLSSEAERFFLGADLKNLGVDVTDAKSQESVTVRLQLSREDEE